MGSRGHGQRGGARVVYCHHNERLPVFLITAYPNNRKANLSKAESNAMKRLVPALVARYLKRHRESDMTTKKKTPSPTAKKTPRVARKP